MAPKSPAHVALGAALKRRRVAAGVSTRQVIGFSAGHVSNVENGNVTPSEALINAYAQQFGGGAELGALYTKLRLSGERRRALERVRRNSNAMPIRPPQDVTAAVTPEAISRHYTTTDQEAHCTLGEAGQIETLRIRTTVQALSPDVSLFYAAAFYEADPRRGVTTIDAVEGMVLLGTDELESGVVRAYFRLERQLDLAEQPLTVAYDIRVHSSVRAIPKLLFYARPGMERMSLTVTFHPAAVPIKLWQVAGRNVIMASHSPTDEVYPSALCEYRLIFDNLVPEWIYGFSWVW